MLSAASGVSSNIAILSNDLSSLKHMMMVINLSIKKSVNLHVTFKVEKEAEATKGQEG